MIYVTYDNSNGHLTGGFNQDLPSAHEAYHIEVSATEALNWCLYKANGGRTALVAADAAPTIVPNLIVMVNARLVLRRLGILTTYDTYVDGLTGDSGEALKIIWNFSISISRSSLLIPALATAFTLNSAQIDQFFIWAALSIDQILVADIVSLT